jgi:isopentenyl-diphosphate delta-isomerase
MTATEYVVLVDQEDQEIGRAEKLSAHQNNLLHRAFSVFIFRETPQLEVLLQQRALHKYHSPGLWTNACCSHPRFGEAVIAAGERRLKEELGLIVALQDVGWFYYNAHFENGLSEHEIDHVLIGTLSSDQHVQPNPEEVHAYKWQSLDALQEELSMHSERFTAWFAEALKMAIKAGF